MSPASSGTLEVEKYIGACLISQSRPKPANISSREVFFSRLPDVYPGSYVNFDGRFRVQRCNSADRWAGGMPLISFANHQKRTRRPEQEEEQHNPLARLAVHTQGAPLILTKSFNNRRTKKNAPKSFENANKPKGNVESPGGGGGGVDAVSVTSDESSGSANSDNCLPRIIKPRKRRKKDRKPANLGRSLHPDGFSTDSASPDIDTNPVFRSLTPFVFDPHAYGLVPDTLQTTKPANGRRYEIYDVSETPQLHHSFEDVEEVEDGVDINGNQPTTVCQCRYCDPSGQIWDVDRSCYSPFLTAPLQLASLQVDNFLPRCSSSDDLIHGMSSVSLDEAKGRKNTGDLEVSTEIVTSLNGHRDIEIKFFSSSSAENVRASPRGKNRMLSNVDASVRKTCESVNSECKFVSEE